jgi:hypothetical protein
MPTLLGNVPILGQVLKVHAGFVTAVLTCTCHRDNPPIVLRGCDNLVPCRACGKVFAITKVSYDASVSPAMTLDCSMVAQGPKPGATPNN